MLHFQPGTLSLAAMNKPGYTYKNAEPIQKMTGEEQHAGPRQ
jgi:hypothetical protein